MVRIDGGPAAPPPPVSTRDIAGFTARRIGRTRFIEYESTGNGITQTAADVFTYLNISFPFILRRLELQHVDGSDADATTAFTWTLIRYGVHPPMVMTLRSQTGTTANQIIEEFGDNFPMYAQQLRLTTNTTDGHRIYVRLTVEELLE